MKMYAYNVNTYGEQNEITFRTNDVREALDAFITTVDGGVACDFLNGYTGEVMGIANNPDHEDYATDELWLMVQGFYSEQEQEPDPMEQVRRAVEEMLESLPTAQLKKNPLF